MPDISGAVGGLVDLVGPLVSKALTAFVQTTVGMVTLGVVSSIGVWFIAADGNTLRGVVAVAIAAVVFAVLGVMLGLKRAVGSALLLGFSKLHLGQKLGAVLFKRILDVDDADVHGERGVRVATASERLPLKRAEERLQSAVNTLLRADGEKPLGFLRRKLQEAALERVALVTAKRFREDAAAHGGVDLVKVRDELAQKFDELVVDAIEGGLFKVTVLLVVVASALSVGSAVALHRFWV
jgi:hypothetical protein